MDLISLFLRIFPLFVEREEWISNVASFADFSKETLGKKKKNVSKSTGIVLKKTNLVERLIETRDRRKRYQSFKKSN